MSEFAYKLYWQPNPYLIHNLKKMLVLKSSSYSLLVVELLVDLELRLVGALCDANVDLQARGETAEQLDADAQANKGSH